MLTLVLKDSYKTALTSIEKSIHLADAYEFRLDLFKDLNIDIIQNLKNLIHQKTIFTLRMRVHGGEFAGNFNEKWLHLKEYLTLSPDFVDIEENTPKIYLSKIRDQFPKIKILLSYHNFDSTPDDLDALGSKMFQKEGDIYKIATQAHSIFDTLRMMKFSRKCLKEHRPFIGICMGNHGVLTRILAPVLGHYFCYCRLKDFKESNHLGQVSIEELSHVYNYKKHTPSTKVYALLGSPIHQSPSHYTHNHLFNQLKLDAIYVKIEITSDQMPLFFSSITDLFFSGFSITAPLKETAFNFIKSTSLRVKKIQAINTLYQLETTWFGENTDCIGALNAIEEVTSVKNKKFIVLGAGGAARAIIYEILCRGGEPVIVNRSLEKAKNLSEFFSCKYFTLKTLKKTDMDDYDILIQTTAVGMLNYNETLLQKEDLLENKVVFDVIIKPQNTQLIKLAKEKHCTVIYGYKMFIYQAAEQFSLWFKDGIDKQEVLKELENAYLCFVDKQKEGSNSNALTASFQNE